MCSSIAGCYSSLYTPLDSSGVPKTQLFLCPPKYEKGIAKSYTTPIQKCLYKNAFYALQKSRFEYESVLSKDVCA